MERTHDANVVDDRTDVRKEFADFGARFSETLEAVLRPEAFQRLTLQLCELLSFCEALRHRLAVHRGELWLRVESFQVGGAARHREVDDPFRLRSKMQRIDHASGERAGSLRGRGSEK